MSSTQGARPLRDRPSLITYAQLAVYGWFLYGFGPTVPLLRDQLGLSNSVAALHGTMFAITGVMVGLAGPRFARALGRGKSLRVGALLMALGLTIYCSGSVLAITLFGTLVLGVGAALVVVFANAFLTAHQGAAAPASLAEANMLGALSGMVAPAAVGLCVAVGWGWRAGLMVAAVAAIVVEVFRGPLSAFDRDHQLHDPSEVKHPLPQRFWWACAALSCLVAVEFCLVLWSSDLLRVRGNLGVGAAAASLTSVVAGMAIGRAYGSVLARKTDPERLLLIAIAVALVGFLGAWSSTNAAVILACLLICGSGVGMHWPLGITRAVRASDHQADRATSAAVVTTGFATGIAPFILGAVADRTSIEVAFAVVPILLVAATALVLLRPVPADDNVTAPLSPL